MTNRKWRDVEAALSAEWNDCFRKSLREVKPCAQICPGCRVATLRYYIARFHEENPRAGFWVWCPNCFRHEHFTGSAPSWWVNDDRVPLDKLEPQPDWLEDHWDQLMDRPASK